jgi:predicted DNA-binding protein with PD1-like motif
MRYHHFGDGRYVLRLDSGEEVVASLCGFARERKVQAGWVWAMGSLDQVVLGFLDPKEKVYLKRTFEERLEIGMISGNLGMQGDESFAHLHATVSPRELLSYTGHVHEAKVGVVVEAFVQALPGRLDRTFDEAHGFLRMELPGEGAARERSSGR